MEQEIYTDSAEALRLVNKELGIPSSHIAVSERGKYFTCLVSPENYLFHHLLI